MYGTARRFYVACVPWIPDMHLNAEYIVVVAFYGGPSADLHRHANVLITRAYAAAPTV